jgi:hypothetical protein
MQAATNTAKQPAPLLTDSEQAWLDGCPVGDARSLTFNGRTVTVDRRITLPHQIAPQFFEPRWEINTGTGHRPF